MSTEIFFFDTYALIEIIKGSSNYKKYKGAQIITTLFNLMELYYALLRDFDKETAEYYFNKYLYFVIKIPIQVVKEAMQFKLANRKEKLSYIDCVGYLIAINLDIKFLTGDIKFENKPHVEFAR